MINFNNNKRLTNLVNLDKNPTNLIKNKLLINDYHSITQFNR